MIALLMLAAEEAKEGGSHTAFFIAGGRWPAWAVLIAFIGIAAGVPAAPRGARPP